MATVQVSPKETPDASGAMESPPLFLRSLDATWTRARWEQLDHTGVRYEIIDGVLYMSTSPRLFHQWIVSELIGALRDQLVRTGVAFVFTAPVGLFLPGENAVQPDLVVVRQEDRAILQSERIRGVPALLVEILSPSNAEYDLTTKRTAYARAGVPEYWIVRPKERDILVYSEPERASGEYLHAEQVKPDGELISPTLPFRVPIAAFFVGADYTTPRTPTQPLFLPLLPALQAACAGSATMREAFQHTAKHGAYGA